MYRRAWASKVTDDPLFDQCHYLTSCELYDLYRETSAREESSPQCWISRVCLANPHHPNQANPRGCWDERTQKFSRGASIRTSSRRCSFLPGAHTKCAI